MKIITYYRTKAIIFASAYQEAIIDWESARNRACWSNK